jgi:hypothetical protein
VLNKHGLHPGVHGKVTVPASGCHASFPFPCARSCCYYTSLQPLLSCLKVILHAHASYHHQIIPWYVSELRSVTLDLLGSLMLVLLWTQVVSVVSCDGKACLACPSLQGY